MSHQWCCMDVKWTSMSQMVYGCSVNIHLTPQMSKGECLVNIHSTTKMLDWKHSICRSKHTRRDPYTSVLMQGSSFQLHLCVSKLYAEPLLLETIHPTHFYRRLWVEICRVHGLDEMIVMNGEECDVMMDEDAGWIWCCDGVMLGRCRMANMLWWDATRMWYGYDAKIIPPEQNNTSDEICFLMRRFDAEK